MNMRRNSVSFSSRHKITGIVEVSGDSQGLNGQRNETNFSSVQRVFLG